MKKINLLLIVLLQIFAFQAVGQSVLNDGRDVSMAPSTPVEAPVATQGDQLVSGSDFDIPDQLDRPGDLTDIYFPADFDILREELQASAGVQAMTEKINALSDQVAALVEANEQLREENRIIRKSLSACCASGELGLSAKDAYLVQNSPNPFSEFSEIKYFVPENLQNATMEIRNVQGELIKAYDLGVKGYGNLNVGEDLLQTGTYIYSLHIDGQVIDSKVMILTK